MLDKAARDLIEELVTEDGLTNAREVWRRVSAAMPDLLADERTVRTWVRRFTPQPGDPWRLTSPPRADAALILPALAVALQLSKGRVHLTLEVARHVALVRRAAPDLDVATAYRCAVRYSREGRDTSDLDAFLAYGPWRGDEEREAYAAAVASGWVPALGFYDQWAVGVPTVTTKNGKEGSDESEI